MSEPSPTLHKTRVDLDGLMQVFFQFGQSIPEGAVILEVLWRFSSMLDALMHGSQHGIHLIFKDLITM